MSANQNRKKKKWDVKILIRIICIVLVILLAGSYLISALVS